MQYFILPPGHPLIESFELKRLVSQLHHTVSG
jgi:hypothetical protein